ncbi:hypothetical protein [Natrinema thermotolerans]
MHSVISSTGERQDRVPTKEARSLRQHYAAERQQRLLAEARVVAGLEGDR